ncbi:MAG TPA: dethiobiotin synthase [Methylomirabilota bacterium]|nr:dethiobiotin synthase [Methylomirabilota bacterium]
MNPRTVFVTGTDTGVGKTVFSAALVAFLRQAGTNVAASKPLCSGGRDDARRLQEALGQRLSLDTVNPWHFRAPLAPLLAARREGRRVPLASVLRHLRQLQTDNDILVVEGAGGLLSPLGEGFTALELILALRAQPVIICPNRLGTINQILMALAALPSPTRHQTRVVLMEPKRSAMVHRLNHRYLADCLGARRVQPFPWLPEPHRLDQILGDPRARTVLAHWKPPLTGRT